MRRFYGLILCVALFSVSSAFGIDRCDLQFSNGITLHQVPIANTEVLRNRGLSGRSNAGNGMLFVWPTVEPRVFWMRNTHMPLSIGFFDQQNKLFLIKEMKPDTDTFHHSIHPAKYAFELASGQFEHYHLGLGTRLEKIVCDK